VKAAVKQKIHNRRQEELRKELAGSQQELESYPSSTPNGGLCGCTLSKGREVKWKFRIRLCSDVAGDQSKRREEHEAGNW
jgi:hypothetical protein